VAKFANHVGVPALGQFFAFGLSAEASNQHLNKYLMGRITA